MEEIKIELIENNKIIFIFKDKIISNLNTDYRLYRTKNNYNYLVKITNSAIHFLNLIDYINKEIDYNNVFINNTDIIIYNKDGDYIFRIKLDIDLMQNSYINGRYLKLKKIYYQFNDKYLRLIKSLKIKSDNKLYTVAINKVDIIVIYILSQLLAKYYNKNKIFNYVIKQLFYDMIKMRFGIYIKKYKAYSIFKYIDLDEMVYNVYLKYLPIFLSLVKVKDGLKFIYSFSILFIRISNDVKTLIKKNFIKKGG